MTDDGYKYQAYELAKMANELLLSWGLSEMLTVRESSRNENGSLFTMTFETMPPRIIEGTPRPAGA